MTVTGQVRNGVVVLDDAKLAEGTRVRIEPIDVPTPPTVAERWEKVTGMADGLPSDLAKNHDHYLHGQPKR